MKYKSILVSLLVATGTVHGQAKVGERTRGHVETQDWGAAGARAFQTKGEKGVKGALGYERAVEEKQKKEKTQQKAQGSTSSGIVVKAKEAVGRAVETAGKIHTGEMLAGAAKEALAKKGVTIEQSTPQAKEAQVDIPGINNIKPETYRSDVSRSGKIEIPKRASCAKYKQQTKLEASNPTCWLYRLDIGLKDGKMHSEFAFSMNSQYSRLEIYQRVYSGTAHAWKRIKAVDGLDEQGATIEYLIGQDFKNVTFTVRSPNGSVMPSSSVIVHYAQIS